MRRFELTTPNTVEACLEGLAKHGPDARVVAGGTDLLPQMKNGVTKPAMVIDLSGVAALRALRGGCARAFASAPR